MALTVISGEIAAQPLNDNFSEGKANLDTHLAELVTDAGGAHGLVYETGTWTPSLTFGNGAVGMIYSRQYGRYTRINDLINVEIDILVSTKGTSTGDARIGGLPFSSNASTPWRATPLATFQKITFPAGVLAVSADLPASRNSVDLVFCGSLLAFVDDTNITDDLIIRIQFSYKK